MYSKCNGVGSVSPGSLEGSLLQHVVGSVAPVVWYCFLNLTVCSFTTIVGVFSAHLFFESLHMYSYVCTVTVFLEFRLATLNTNHWQIQIRSIANLNLTNLHFNSHFRISQYPFQDMYEHQQWKQVRLITLMAICLFFKANY